MYPMPIMQPQKAEEMARKKLDGRLSKANMDVVVKMHWIKMKIM